MTDLRTRGLIDQLWSADGKKGYYEVQFELFMTVDGRNLRYGAVFEKDSRKTGLAEGRISIAAAFRPGTD